MAPFDHTTGADAGAEAPSVELVVVDGLLGEGAAGSGVPGLVAGAWAGVQLVRTATASNDTMVDRRMGSLTLGGGNTRGVGPDVHGKEVGIRSRPPAGCGSVGHPTARAG